MDSYYDHNFPDPQTSRIKIPWLISLFLLVVFSFSTPYYFLAYGGGVISSVSGDVGSGGVEAGAEMLAGSNWMRQTALFALVIFTFIHFLQRKQNLFHVNGLLGWLVLFYVIWSCLSVVWSDDTFFTMKRVGILVFLFLGALGLAERISLRDIVLIVFIVTGLTLVSGLIFDIQHNIFHPLRAGRRFSGALHPIQQGWNCALLAISALTLFRMASGKRFFYVCVVFVALFFCYITRSRMPIAAALVGLAVNGSLIVMKRHQVEIVLGIIVLGCLMYFLLGEEVQSSGALSAGRGFTWSGRIELWTELMRYAYERPLLGYGYNSMLSPRYILTFVQEAGWFAPSTHSGYMEALLGLGFIGGIAFVLMLLLAVIRAFVTYISNQIPENAFVVAVLIWLCSCLITESVVIVRPIFPAFLSLVLLVKIGLIKQEEVGSENPSY